MLIGFHYEPKYLGSTFPQPAILTDHTDADHTKHGATKNLRDQPQAILQAMQEEMESYRDERSEQWQEAEKGGAFQEIIDQADTARAFRRANRDTD